MRANATTTLLGRAALLVPYAPKHVPTYHSWMEDPELREATASERLSLEEEEEMQRSWTEDDAKLTFIVCDANRPGRPPVGDVNLFFEQRSRSPSKSEGGGGGESSEAEPPQTSAPSYLHETAEVEVMIADPLSRGKGIAKEAVLLCLWWASVGATTAAKGARGSDSSSSSPVLLPRLRLAKVKIGRKNAASLALFKSMGFAKTGGSDFFQEDHLGLELFVRGEEEEREEEEEKGGAEAPSPPPPPPVTPSLCPLLASVGEYAVVGEVEGSEDAAAAS